MAGKFYPPLELYVIVTTPGDLPLVYTIDGFLFPQCEVDGVLHKFRFAVSNSKTFPKGSRLSLVEKRVGMASGYTFKDDISLGTVTLSEHANQEHTLPPIKCDKLQLNRTINEWSCAQPVIHINSTHMTITLAEAVYEHEHDEPKPRIPETPVTGLPEDVLDAINTFFMNKACPLDSLDIESSDEQ